MDDYNSFSTIDHLVEFGMGIAIAQQMVNTMNHCIGNMQVPGAGNTLTSGKPTPQEAFNLPVLCKEKRRH